RPYPASVGGADVNVNSSGMPTTASDGKPEALAFRDPNDAWHLTSLQASPAQPVGGPYTVTNGGLTVQPGYAVSPGNANNPVTTGARAWVGAAGGSMNIGANWTG